MARWWNGIHTIRLQRDGSTLLLYGSACWFESDPSHDVRVAGYKIKQQG